MKNIILYSISLWTLHRFTQNNVTLKVLFDRSDCAIFLYLKAPIVKCIIYKTTLNHCKFARVKSVSCKYIK